MMRKMRLSLGVIGTALLLASGPATAQIMPAPQKAPRTPVNKEVLSTGKTTSIPASRVLEGEATVIDSERLRIQDIEVRLFGVVPPQLGASYGPQARAVVDALTQGKVTCQVKDRSRDGSYLALCRNESNADFGIELLRRGLAATARGSLRTSEYGTPYIAAEQAAQTQRLGIWSTSLPAAASESSIREAAIKAESIRAETEQAKAELAKAEAAKAEALKAVEAAKTASDNVLATAPTTTIKLGSAVDTHAISPLPHFDASSTALRIPLASTDPAPVQDPAQDMVVPSSDMLKLADDRSFFEKYQLLLSGVLLFLTTLAIVIGVVLSRLIQRKEELRSIAAALRGEMMAARSVCQARLSKIAHDRTDKETSWPRIRTTVFQAYVSKLGCLGAELSRQIASIYGMASDYASYYNTTDSRPETTSKRQALEALVQHIEEISPKLSQIEQTGVLPKTPKPVSFGSVLPAPARTLSLSATPTPPSKGPGKPPPKTESDAEVITPPPPSDVSLRMAEAKNEIVSELHVVTPAGDINSSEKEEEIRAKRAAMLAKSAKLAESATKKTPTTPTKTTPQKVAQKTASTTTTAAAKKATQAVASVANASAKIETAAHSAIKAVSNINFRAPILERLSKLKSFASSQLELDKPAPEKMDEFTIPDYANLTEEELEALLYAEEEFALASPAGKSHRAG